MAPFDDLTKEQGLFLRALAERSSWRTMDWILASHLSGAELISSESSANWEDVPHDQAFYLDLENKGYIGTRHGSHGDLHIWPTAHGFEYARYAGKSRVARGAISGYKQVFGERAWWVYLVIACGGYAVGRALEALADTVWR